MNTSTEGKKNSVPYLVKPEYKNGKRRKFPQQPDSAKRNKDFYRQVAEAIYSAHLNNKSGILYTDQEEFANNRLYATGDQAREKYIEYFFKENSAADNASTSGTAYSVDGVGGWTNQTRGERREGFMNVLFDIVSDAPKIVSTLVSKFEKAEYDIVCDAIDEMSGDEIENAKYKLWSMKENLAFYKEYYANMGADFKEPDFLPESEDEMELWEDSGGFKPNHAATQEQLIQHTMDYSNWLEVKKEMMTDAVTNAYFACKDEWDSNSGKARTVYVDVARLLIQHSQHRDYHDSEWAGYFKEVPMTVIQQQGATPQQMREMSKVVKGMWGNPAEPLSINEGQVIETDDVSLWKVCVLDFEFITTDSTQYLERKNEFGRKKYIKQDYGTKNKDNNKQTTKILDKRTKYCAMWVVGTDFIYNQGPAYDITRPTPKEVNLSFHVYRLKTKPIIKTLIPIFDNLMILWLKYQNAIALAINDGYAIDYDAISAIKMGGDKYSQEKVIKRFLQTGILIFKRKQAGNPQGYTQGVPVEHLQSNLSTAFISFREGFNTNLMLIERLTGFTPMITGGTPAERAPVKNSEMAFDATNDFLRNILSGYLQIKENMAENISLLIQMKIKQGWTDGYEKVIGKKSIKVLKLAEGNNARYGFKLVGRPTDLERKEIFESAKIALSNGREGKPGINEADYFKIIRIINSGGSLRKAEMLLQASIRRAKKEASKEAKENMQLQNKGNMELEQLKQNNELAKIRVEGEEDRKTEELKAQREKELEQMKVEKETNSENK